MHELRYALRQVRQHPGFTLVAVLTLALGIGANTAIFSVMDQLLVRPLPVAQPERLALLGQARGNGQVDYEFNYPLFTDYRRLNPVFSALCATAEQAVGLGTDGATERHRALLVSGNYFRMLGVEPALGRVFAPNEGVEVDDAPVVVLSHGLWRRRFGAEPQVIGRRVTVNGKSFTVIGVAPREFRGTERGVVPDLYVPITMYGQLVAERPGGEHPLATRYFTWHRILGRLKDGISHEQARLAMDGVAGQIYAATPANTSTNLAVLPGAQGFTYDLRDARLPLNLLFAVAGLVLLIACANLANLQLARATGRTREFAIRLALGAGRTRLIRGLLTESVLIALLGGALGVGVAVQLVEWLGQFQPPHTEIRLVSGPEARVLWFALAVAVLTGVAFGLAPAWRASRPEVLPELKGGGTSTEGRRRRWTLRDGLVVLQVGLSLVVLVSAGLCLRSLAHLQRRDPGLEPSRVVLLSFDLGLNNYGASAARAFYDQLLERARALPGVEAASLGANTPLSGRAWGMSVERVEGYEPGPNEHPWGDVNVVAGDYFRAVGVPLLAGRDFDVQDRAGGAKTIIVNEAFVQRYWPGQVAVGRRLYQHGDTPGGVPTEVVGVIGTTQVRGLADPPRPAMYLPWGQRDELALTVVVRTGLEPSATLVQLREIAQALDPRVPVFGATTLAQQKAASLALQRMAAGLLAGFGVLALLLAALGIYAVLAYAVGRRTREIGVRMALGAQVTDVLRLVFRQGIGLSAGGLAVGVLGAVALTRVIRGFLFEVRPLDPLTFGGVCLLLGGVALLACWIPARRAARVAPMEALRNE